ncbi:SDR family NAD(P)-dependent oxidoreductase [Sciscionella marina]|uniref:SDR family NAD(P)-dependent oxidoreductase n=1 Tax=Sciscionella marina TaxID=508770 RepID=UPI0003652791|nr:SDR family oxidoreductase [Sciscionella marina]
MELGLDDKNVFVTGATGGIGAAIARAFHAEHANVALGFHTDEERARGMAEELRDHRATALAVRYDLAETGSVRAAVETVTRQWGPVDVLVACAVRWHTPELRAGRFEDAPARLWEPVVQDNITATVHTAQAVIPGMRARGWGRIVLLSSHVARDGGPGLEFYGAAKAALEGFARSLAHDVGRDGILVNLVSPGLVSTERVLAKLPAELREREQQRTPTGVISSPDSVARAVVFLSSAANDNITAETVTVSGGR